ncbi:MAG: hypothetical protein AAF939_10650 [Planctomycetota bacterium]
MPQKNVSLGYWIIGSGLVGFVVIGVVASGILNSDPDALPVASQIVSTNQAKVNKIEQPSLEESLKLQEQDMTIVGDVKRPKRDIAFEEGYDRETGPKDESESIAKSIYPSSGNAPAVEKDANVQVAGLYEELNQEDGGPLSARSALFSPEPFDARQYEQDPEAWLAKIRPGRVFQPAQPGVDVQPIQSQSEVFNSVLQGEKVVLEVKAAPGSPVSFYTPQVGEFENRLTSQSVAANENGIARAVYTATAGTNGLVDIIAASPLHSGQVRYRVRVSLPETN